MRIGLVSREYPPETAKGGMGTQTYVKAQGLAARGHEVFVLSQSVNRLRHEYLDGAVRVTRIPTFDRMPVHSDEVEWLTYSAEVAAELAAMNSRTPLDLVDAPEWGGEVYMHLLNRRDWNRRPPVVVQIHGSLLMFAHISGWPDQSSEFYRVGTAMESASLRLADAVYSSSAYSADWCARHYGLDRSLIPVIHTGVDTKVFRPHCGPKSDAPVIAFAGKVTRSKGVVTLLEACGRLLPEFPDLRVTFMGRADDSAVRELRAKALAYGSPNLLDLAGFIERADLPALLSGCHVFASPSPCEGGPCLTLLEAMACGLPVVACEGTGAAEVVAPGQTGMLVPPADVEALADVLRRLLSDQQLQVQLGTRARRYVEAEADTGRCLDRIEELYRALIGRPLFTEEAGAA